MSEIAPREKYGMEFPGTWHDLEIELWAMYNRHKVGAGGLGVEKHTRNAMIMSWPEVFGGEREPGWLNWREEMELLTWAWCNYEIVVVVGHASAGKTHFFGHLSYLHFLADPFNTIVTLTSTHIGGLKKRLWADVNSAAKTSLAGKGFMHITPYNLSMRPAVVRDEMKYIIEGIAVDKINEAEEKIQGNHARGQRLIVIDEAQGTAKAIFEASANLMSDPNFHMAMLANPTKRYSELGSWAEPKKGWNFVDPDKDQWWETKRDAVCVRLDGLRSANIRAGRVIFPFLIKDSYVDKVEKRFGKNSPRYWAYVRGWFCPDGDFDTVFTSAILSNAEGKFEYDYKPVRIAAFDPAFEGGDDRTLIIGEYGLVNGEKFATNVVKITDIQVEVMNEGRGKEEWIDFQIAMKVRQECERHGVKPENLIIDTTGAGRSIAVLLTRDWGQVQRCDFGGKATDRKVEAGEEKVANELFDRFVTELWFAARIFVQEGMVKGIDESYADLREQACAREFETVAGGKISIESKKDMNERLGRSPDDADALCMLIELLRRHGAVASGLSMDVSLTEKEKALLERAVEYAKVGDDSNFAIAGEYDADEFAN